MLLYHQKVFQHDTVLNNYGEKEKEKEKEKSESTLGISDSPPHL